MVHHVKQQSSNNFIIKLLNIQLACIIAKSFLFNFLITVKYRTKFNV